MLKFTDNLIGQMTLRCNLNCKYCYEGKNIKKENKLLSVPSFKEALDSYIYQRCVLGDRNNTVNWHFHGGEPLLYDIEDFKECIRYIKRRRAYFPNVSFCIQSNGILLTEEIAEIFVKENISFGYSFDGYNVTDRMSVSSNKSLIDHLRKIHKSTGLKMGCLSVFSKNNMKDWFYDMQSIQDFTDSFGINVLVPSEDVDDLAPTPEDQWVYWLEPCLKSLMTDKPLLERQAKMFVERFISDVVLITEPRPIKTGCFDRICGHGVNMISCNPDQSLFNCDKYLEEGPFIEDRFVSDTKTRDFLGLQQIKRYGEYCKQMFALEKETGCDTCYVRNMCLGGCQSYNLSRYGKLKLDTGMCDIYKKVYAFLRTNWITILQKHSIQCTKDILNINNEFLRELEERNLKICIDKNYNTAKVLNK